MNFRWKKRGTYLTIAIFFISGGIEYAVVFPSIWLYLERLGAENTDLLGVAVSAFSVSSLVVGPVVGRWFDVTHNAKLILLLMNMFEIAGSLLYFAAKTPWMVVASRFICGKCYPGLGGSAGPALLADISHSTTLKERTAVLANFQACRQLGLLFGPVFNLVFKDLNWTIGPYHVDQLTSPGIFMAIVGLIQEVACLFLYTNLAILHTQQRLTDSLRPTYSGEHEPGFPNHNTPPVYGSCNTVGSSWLTGSSLNSDPDVDIVESVSSPSPASLPVYHHQPLVWEGLSGSKSSDEMIEDAEHFMGGEGAPHFLQRSLASEHQSLLPPSPAMPNDHSSDGQLDTGSPIMRRWNIYVNEFIRDEVIAVLGLAFVSYFAQTALEAIITPLTQKFYNFGILENSLVFLSCGIEVLFAYLSINLLSKKLEDRVLIVAGGLLMIFSLSWYLAFVPYFNDGDLSSLPWFAVGIFTNLYGISLLIACCVSLYSKLISQENQGIGHGLRRSLMCVAMILGPLWGGGATSMLHLLFSLPLAMVTVFTVLFGCSYPRLEILTPEQQSDAEEPSVHQNAESDPLLS